MEWYSFPFLLALLSLLSNWVHADPQVPCYFIFGDSLSDNGNNNNLSTSAKVNYPPYGIDFPGGPTGRFGNGKNVPDIIAEMLGFTNPIPPFATVEGDAILKGVNYASGGAGILPETGKGLGDRITMDMQLKNHASTVAKIFEILKSNETVSNLLSKCIYSIAIGSNDYLNNYYKPQFYQTSNKYTPEEFATLLLQKYSEQIETLYSLGARKVALYALGAIGCTPNAVALYGTTNGSICVDDLNQAAQHFNERLLTLVNELSMSMANAKITYINPFRSATGTKKKFFSFGLVMNASCCEVRKGEELCVPNSVPCPDRNKYMYFDSVHPTEFINTIAAEIAYGTTTPFNAYPFNISSLALSTKEDGRFLFRHFSLLPRIP